MERVYDTGTDGGIQRSGMTIRPMKLDYQFLAQTFKNLMRASGYYSLFIIFPKAQHTSKHEDFCQKTVRSTLIILALNS